MGFAFMPMIRSAVAIQGQFRIRCGHTFAPSIFAQPKATTLRRASQTEIKADGAERLAANGDATPLRLKLFLGRLPWVALMGGPTWTGQSGSDRATLG